MVSAVRILRWLNKQNKPDKLLYIVGKPNVANTCLLHYYKMPFIGLNADTKYERSRECEC